MDLAIRGEGDNEEVGELRTLCTADCARIAMNEVVSNAR
jgi:hypothetical protein